MSSPSTQTHPSNTIPSTSAHPSSSTIDPTTQDAPRGQSTTTTTSSPELSSLKIKLKNALRQFPDFPEPGILFEDIMPIFADPILHESLIKALELHITQHFGEQRPEVIVGLDARGFLFGPSLALRLGAAFVPVRKRGKLPGPTVTASYKKEYGEDFFQMQSDGVKTGQRVLVVDDIIATGGSAAAAGSLVKQLGGTLLGYVFILELDFLKGRDKLDAPAITLLSGQTESSK
ncbi:adenine phosphoribosyltransferas-like protein 1 [Pseudovirgaria hyperparasitica]|uniref:adenine phosphoribosyltransferase n=1 Tax=Pseudovirgaria hyperparasitica TaxID=470096 RepID=A0A6A6VXS1_9PEZI|nr:adenine phosphoribosyltransferas-like protein 1 [Pseudovirgaria hyperparasitica]KAF2755458.1 adenine phosphoribosyltransferas-like protein 1 [Pseudovirgaria hyperparasitica]